MTAHWENPAPRCSSQLDQLTTLASTYTLSGYTGTGVRMVVMAVERERLGRLMMITATHRFLVEVQEVLPVADILALQVAE